jgi:hypothetical protein
LREAFAAINERLSRMSYGLMESACGNIRNHRRNTQHRLAIARRYMRIRMRKVVVFLDSISVSRLWKCVCALTPAQSFACAYVPTMQRRVCRREALSRPQTHALKRLSETVFAPRAEGQTRLKNFFVGVEKKMRRNASRGVSQRPKTRFTRFAG